MSRLALENANRIEKLIKFLVLKGIMTKKEAMLILKDENKLPEMTKKVNLKVLKNENKL